MFINKNIDMAIRRPTIVMPRGSVERLCKAEGKGKTSVYAALNFTSNSEEAERIRKVAVSMYGGIRTTKVIP